MEVQRRESPSPSPSPAEIQRHLDDCHQLIRSLERENSHLRFLAKVIRRSRRCLRHVWKRKEARSEATMLHAAWKPFVPFKSSSISRALSWNLSFGHWFQPIERCCVLFDCSCSSTTKLRRFKDGSVQLWFTKPFLSARPGYHVPYDMAYWYGIDWYGYGIYGCGMVHTDGMYGCGRYISIQVSVIRRLNIANNVFSVLDSREKNP